MEKSLPPDEKDRLLEEGARLLAERRFFQAHEAFENLWNATTGQAERDVWQGMAQVAASLVKYERGELATAITLLAKAESRLTGNHLLRGAAEGLSRMLDGLRTPVICDMEIPDTGVPSSLLEALRGILADHRDRAGGDPLS